MSYKRKSPTGFLVGLSTRALESYAVFWQFHYVAGTCLSLICSEFSSSPPLDNDVEGAAHSVLPPSPKECPPKHSHAQPYPAPRAIVDEHRASPPRESSPGNSEWPVTIGS
jgi:hypothetical protein